MEKMDLKERFLMDLYAKKIQNQGFDELDILGFLIFIRRHIEDPQFKSIHDLSDLIAHRERNKGIAQKAITAAIENDYDTIGNSMVIKDYYGIESEKWKEEWKKLLEEIGVEYSESIYMDITLCFMSLAQFTEYYSSSNEGISNRIGKMVLGCGKGNVLGLTTTEGKSDSYHVTFFKEGPYDIKNKKIFYLKPVITERIDGKLRLKDEDGYII